MTKLVEDLSARKRRGELDEAEEKQLHQMLAASVQARLMHGAGLEIDQEDCVLSGDEALAERIARRLVPPPLPRRRRMPGRLLVAAAILTTGAAAAGMAPIVVRAVQRLVVGARTDVVVQLPRVHDAGKAPAPSPLAHGSPTPSVSIVPTAEAPPVSPPREEVAPAGRPREPKASAAELYAQANRARGVGDAQRAIALYDAVQREHPRSAQSGAVDVPLGILHAQAGDLDAAAGHFRRYLSRQPPGPLAPEALWGLGQVYVKTARTEEANSVWAQIIERYPDSAYAPFARAKLRVEPTQD